MNEHQGKLKKAADLLKSGYAPKRAARAARSYEQVRAVFFKTTT